MRDDGRCWICGGAVVERAGEVVCESSWVMGFVVPVEGIRAQGPAQNV